MKYLFTIAFGVIFSLSAMASSTCAPPDSTTGIIERTESLMLIDKGKTLLREGKTRDALILFRDAASKDPNGWKPQYWVAYSHFRLKNFGYARQYGHSAVAKGGNDVDSEVYAILGGSYHNLGQLDSAQLYYNKALTTMSRIRLRELDIEHKIAECDFAVRSLAATPVQRAPLRGEVNSGSNDYSPVLSKDGKTLYFTSRRGNTTGGKMNPDDQEYFEDIYKAQWNAEAQSWDSISNDIERLNSNGFDALSYMSADGLKAIVICNNTATDAKKQTKSSDICEAEFSNKGKWNQPKPIANKSINTAYFEGYATMTADGNTMYFVSDRKNEQRSTEIYVVKKVGKKWGIAQVLSDSINTTGRETTPFITPDGRFLFFSSDGHTGMGGLDVYVCENTGSGWSTAKNLGSAINTVNDDSHFVVYKDLQKIMLAGFTISGQKSSLDLFEADLDKVTLPVKL